MIKNLFPPSVDRSDGTIRRSGLPPVFWIYGFFEDVSGSFEHLPFPSVNHVGVNTEPTGKLSGGFIILNCGQSNFRFELWTVCFALFTHRQILLIFENYLQEHTEHQVLRLPVEL